MMASMRMHTPASSRALLTIQRHQARHCWSRPQQLPLAFPTSNPRIRAGPCRSILDSYRQSKQESGGTATAEAPKPKSKQAVDEGECLLDCVQQVYNLADWESILRQTRDTDQLVVVDFYKTACGACKYIQPGFVKLCTQAHDEHKPVVFVKHNVIDEDDEDEEQTDLAQSMQIKNVPMFKFFKRGQEIDSFAARDRKKVADAINKHTQPGTVSEHPTVDDDE